MIDLRKIQEQLMLFFSLPKSKIIQWYFSSILVEKTYSRNEFHTFHSERYRFATSDPVKALETTADHRQNNQRLHIVQGKTKNRTTLHNLPKSIHKIQLKPNLDDKNTNFGLWIYLSLLLLKTVHNEINLEKKAQPRSQGLFTGLGAGLNRPWERGWRKAHKCHTVPVPFHYKKGEEFLGFAPYSQPKTRHVWYQNF